jgi:N-acetylglucosaminyldiphosphoundecaprenol N-acetyl-beta-D-mannosaminyltransferase
VLPLAHFSSAAPKVWPSVEELLENRYPGLLVVGTYTSVSGLNSASSNSLPKGLMKQDLTFWVELSTPKQEEVHGRCPKLNTTLMVGVGAAFDFHSGRVKQAPLDSTERP